MSDFGAAVSALPASVAATAAAQGYVPTAAQRFAPGGRTAIAMGGNTGSKADREAAAGKTATDFESMFVSQMLESMYAGVKVDKTFGGGEGERMFRSMLNQEYGKAIAKSNTLGLGASIKTAILHLQEITQK